MLCRSSAGIAIDTDANITVVDPKVFRRHLRRLTRLPILTNSDIELMLDPSDPQNTHVATALIMTINTIEQLPTDNHSPTQLREHKAIYLIGYMFWSFTEPFINTTFPLNGQVATLGSFGHSAFTTFGQTGYRFMPPQLYLDMVGRVKHVNWMTRRAGLV